jgi:hypothetical protein
MDAHVMTVGDPKSSWTERRLSHQNLVTVFMLSLLIDRTIEAERENCPGRPQ